MIKFLIYSRQIPKRVADFMDINKKSMIIKDGVKPINGIREPRFTILLADPQEKDYKHKMVVDFEAMLSDLKKKHEITEFEGPI